MKIAYVHVLPLEYYPPATNFLDLLASRPGVAIRVFTTPNLKDREPYGNEAIDIRRLEWAEPEARRSRRMAAVLRWHWRVARALRSFGPDMVVSVEPHSAIAVWLYYRLLGGAARLFIHHHEYYEPADYRRNGMSIPRLGARLEQASLYPRATWISQTNGERLELARSLRPRIPEGVWAVLPNYPPSRWAAGMAGRATSPANGALRLVYVGSASFEDTYIEEIVEWASNHPESVRLHVCGYNVSSAVWRWLEERRRPNVTFDPEGCAYHDLPRLLEDFDVGLVLYKGNTRNFVHNVPNKVFEYLQCGLEVWYPREMIGTRNFAQRHDLGLRECDFSRISERAPAEFESVGKRGDHAREFTAERAFEPLFASMGLALREGQP